MTCSCIQGDNFNFHIDAYKEGLVYQDVSKWVLDSNYQVPTSYHVDITLPEKQNAIRVEILLSGTIYPQDLGLTEFPDGIYKISLVECTGSEFKGCCGKIYTRYALIIPGLECCLKDAYARLDYSEVNKVQVFFDQAKLSIELRKTKEAAKLVQKGKLALQSLNCNCPCL